MPAFSTHYIFALELASYAKALADFPLSKQAFLIGSQGPDIFFFHRILPTMPGKSLRRVGSKLHRAKPSEILTQMRAYCLESDNGAVAKSYVFGFILHYALDRKCHPYIYSLQEKIKKSNPRMNSHSIHNDIEFAADTYFLNKRLGIKNPQLFDTSATVGDDDAVIDEIGRLWQYVLPRVINVDASAKNVSLAIKDIKTVQKILLDKYSLKKPLIRVAELFVSPISKNFRFTSMFRPRDLETAKKYVNISKDKWTSPYSAKEYDLSLEELFDEAKDDARKMLFNFQAGVSCRDITSDISFLTGVEAE